MEGEQEGSLARDRSSNSFDKTRCLHDTTNSMILRISNKQIPMSIKAKILGLIQTCRSGKIAIPSISGLTLSIDVTTMAFTAIGTTDASGTFVLVTPDSPPGILGVDLHAQFLTAPCAGGDDVMSSRGLQLTVQP